MKLKVIKHAGWCGLAKLILHYALSDELYRWWLVNSSFLIIFWTTESSFQQSSGQQNEEFMSKIIQLNFVEKAAQLLKTYS